MQLVTSRCSRLEEELAGLQRAELVGHTELRRTEQLERALELLAQQRREDLAASAANFRELEARVQEMDRQEKQEKGRALLSRG